MTQSANSTTHRDANSESSQILDPDVNLELVVAAQPAVDQLVRNMRDKLRSRVCQDSNVDTKNTWRINNEALEAQQYIVHGYAWFATYAECLRQLKHWAIRLQSKNQFGTLENLLLQVGACDYMQQLLGGINMSQSEFARISDVGISEQDALAFANDENVKRLTSLPLDKARIALVDELLVRDGAMTFGHPGLDEEYDLMREQFRRFVSEKIAPHAHSWHMRDELIPMSLIDEMSNMGVFGLTIPEQYGGLGLGKTAMCVVSEELSRGYIGVGSLGTRSEIAAELILGGGTTEQRQLWLPKIASGEILPTAVFTEPNTGSDLGALRTRAEREDEKYYITGAKTWITHAARADLMTLLARTDPDSNNYRGLSMFLAEKPRGTEDDPFPAQGMHGTEIGVLGYRGMKEYEIGFDRFAVDANNLLGNEEGQGFKQLMQTFESARIQTAARAVGVAQAAFDLALRYAQDRKQFGKSLVSFPRVAAKLANMAVEINIARQLTYFAAREKDAGRRCDLEAGMAKLLGARVAWSCADNAVQIHGGNGFALEYPISRVLCDARILSIFEGAAEIQATVIARRLLVADS